MMETLNHTIVLSDGKLQDRSHVADNKSITMCGEPFSEPCIATSMRMCLQCLILSYRKTADYWEGKIAKGEY